MTGPGRIAVAMSGGVDSSAAAALLLEQGHEIVGFSMRLWNPGRRSGAAVQEPSGRCCSIEDVYDARAVAGRLGFPFYLVDFEEEFDQQVVRVFVDEYLAGRTPSPCVLCNSHMKFEHLLRLAEEVGATRVATGHYARIVRDSATGRYLLYKGHSAEKDQAYFLFGLKQEQLSRAVFPVGGLEKREVRDIARRSGLEIFEKPESQEICFVPDGDYAEFIERYRAENSGEAAPEPLPPGEIVDTRNRVLGAHRGIHHFTIGQRRGLGISGSAPRYVKQLDPATNRVVVAERDDLAVASCRIVRINWIAFEDLARPIRAEVKIRSRHRETPATVTPLEDGSARIDFLTPQFGVSPGQAAVLYEGDLVLGGGWIARSDS